LSHNHSDHSHHSLNGAFVLTSLFAIVELSGGLYANSLALLADAGHMFSDVLALGLALFASKLAQRPADDRMTYGYGKAKILAAQFNGLSLWFLAGWIIWEAIGRLSSPPIVDGQVVVAIGIVGLIINLIVLKWLHGSHDINSRAVFWHVVGDALGSVAAVVAGVVIIFTGWAMIDPILSFLVAAILIYGGWRLVKETTINLMDAVPGHIDINIVRTKVNAMDCVSDIHHIHLWSLADGTVAMSAHIVVEDLNNWQDNILLLKSTLKDMGVLHVTLQPEISR